MYRSDARSNLGLPPSYTKAEVEAAFRRRARLAHPDHGGDAAQFGTLVESRDVLLETLRIHGATVVSVKGPWARLWDRGPSWIGRRRPRRVR